MLQGLHLIPLAFLRCLHDTRLQPAHNSVGCLPVNLAPVNVVVGGCTSHSSRHLPCLLCRCVRFSRAQRPDGSLPAFAWSHRSTPIRLITGRPSLAPSSCTRTVINVPYELPTLWGTVRAYQVPLMQPDGLGPLCPPVTLSAHGTRMYSPCTRHSACLARACQHLWLLTTNDVYREFACAGHTIHPCPAPPRCWQIHLLLAVRMPI